MDSRTIRYNNTRLLLDQVGGLNQFAERLNKGQSQVSQFAGKAPIKGIGNKVARQIEETFNKPHGWLDIIHTMDFSDTPTGSTNPNIQKIFDSLNFLESKGKLEPQLLESINALINVAIDFAVKE